jgi:RNA polymerase sigma-70 factor (ECF subfamily)
MVDTREISLNEINSAAFIELLKAKDGQAFSDLITCIVPKLCSYLSSNFKLPEEDGEEIATDTMLKVNKAIEKFNPQGGAKLSTWIFRIATNTAIDFVRRQKKQPENPLMRVPLDDTISKEVAKKTADQWFRDEAASTSIQKNGNQDQIERMKRALNSLSEQDRSLLIMRLSMEYEEIAAVENTSVPTLRTRYSRAFDRLRHELNKEENI